MPAASHLLDRAELEAVLDFEADPLAGFLAADADLDFVLEELRPFPVVLAVDERPPAVFAPALLAEELPPVFLLELDELVLLPVFLAPVDDLLADEAPLLFADDLDAADPDLLAVLLFAPELFVVELFELEDLALFPAADAFLPADEPLLVDDEPLLLAVDPLLRVADPLLLLPAAADRLFVEPEVPPRVAIDEVSPIAALTAEFVAPATAPAAAPPTISPATCLALSRIVSSDPLLFDFLVAMPFPLFFFLTEPINQKHHRPFPRFRPFIINGPISKPFSGYTSHYQQHLTTYVRCHTI